MQTEEQIRVLINQIESHNQDLEWLSNCALQLSVLLYNLGEEMSLARLKEEQTTIEYLNQSTVIDDKVKKMPVSEAERRAAVDTQGRYQKLDTNYKALIEIIMTIKKKLDSSSQQLRSGV